VQAAGAGESLEADECERDGSKADPHGEEVRRLVPEIDTPPLLERGEDEGEDARAREGQRAIPPELGMAGQVPADRLDLRESIAHVWHGCRPSSFARQSIARAEPPGSAPGRFQRLEDAVVGGEIEGLAAEIARALLEGCRP